MAQLPFIIQQLDSSGRVGRHLLNMDSISETLSLAPKDKLVLFITQMVVIVMVLSVSLFNITMGWDKEHFWMATFTGALGYLMPTPALKLNRKRTEDTTLP